MRRILRLLIISIRREILQWFAWRLFLFTLVVNQVVTPLLGLMIWSVALPGNAAISTYYAMLLIVQLMTVSYEHHTFSNAIYGGTLSHELLKPQPVIIGPLGTNIALRIWHLLMGLPLILIVALVVRVSLDIQVILAAILALLLSATLRFLFTYLLALSAFWSQQAHNIVGFGETLIFLLGGGAAPIFVFPPALRMAAEILPFRLMLGFPAEIMTGSLSSAQILVGYGWQIVWIVLLLLLVRMAWRSGVGHYVAQGG